MWLASPGPRGGRAYDPGRLELFQILYAKLLQWVATPRPDEVLSGSAWENLAFIDAYFPDQIEGTGFEIEEAVEIVFEGRIPEVRPEDAHDVLGTYRLVANAQEITTSATGFTFEDFVRRYIPSTMATVGSPGQ